MSILSPMTAILIRKGKERFETPKRKRQTEKGKGSVIIEAEMGQMWPQAKESWQPPASRRKEIGSS